MGQVKTALAVRRAPPDEAPARRVLPDSLWPVFAAMPVEDRAHGLAVLEKLEADGETAPVLLQAALLHDCGKANAGVGLPHRIARVLLARPAPTLWRALSGAATGWRRPFWVVANHPERGAVWVATRGGADDLVALIRFHEAPAPPGWRGTELERWHAELAAADAAI